MNKDERNTAIIAAALGVAAILLIWWTRGTAQASVTVPVAAPVPSTVVAGSNANNPGYVSYNIPPYNPGSLPNIIDNTILNQPVTSNIGAGCCPGCSGSDDTTDNVGEYLALSGLGNYAGALG